MTNYVTKPIPAEKPTVDFISRPWGSFKQYAFNEDVTVSLMTVKAGTRLSLQSHTARAELWVILDDGCEVQVVLEKELLDTLKNGKSATFTVFQTTEEGIGIPVDLTGFAEGFAALP